MQEATSGATGARPWETSRRPRRARPRAGGRAAPGDFRLGITLGLAATGIAAAAWNGGLAEPAGLATSVTSPAVAALSNDGGTDTITIHVRATGTLRWMVGARDVDIQVPRGTTIAALTDRLSDRYPDLGAMAMLTVGGRDDEMLPLDALVADGDRVDLVAAMAGG